MASTQLVYESGAKVIWLVWRYNLKDHQHRCSVKIFDARSHTNNCQEKNQGDLGGKLTCKCDGRKSRRQRRLRRHDGGVAGKSGNCDYPYMKIFNKEKRIKNVKKC